MRFSERAGAYAAYRPAYPKAAIDALLRGLGPEADLIVADVGAGTGISTNLLAQRVGSVVAIEPNAQMRERAESRLNVRWEDGCAETLPLPDKSVDVAAAFQAFHWFDPLRAFAEFARVARRRLALLQYERDETQPFCAAYAAIARRYATDDTEALRMRTLEIFSTLAGSGLRRAVVPFKQRLTQEGLIGRVDSTSYLPREGEAAAALRREMARLFDRFARDGFVEMALNAYVLAADVA
ncbi:MAG TPA: class I SAM-dependent methyltransferase [Candidatus Baltobacteraceae bacterium]|nr:class I SAM-dependent methyltransferase [Candidatus Baltobacteraceae bacterium]